MENVRHPSGRVNQAEVESAREQHGENKLPAHNRRRGGYIYGSAIATPLIFTHHSRRYFLRHGRFICRGRYALMVAISTLLNFIQEARSTKRQMP